MTAVQELRTVMAYHCSMNGGGQRLAAGGLYWIEHGLHHTVRCEDADATQETWPRLPTRRWVLGSDTLAGSIDVLCPKGGITP
jgi:hypothetical protein